MQAEKQALRLVVYSWNIVMHNLPTTHGHSYSRLISNNGDILWKPKGTHPNTKFLLFII
jgi:hypothetical protein